MNTLTATDRAYVAALRRYERARREKAPTALRLERLRDLQLARARLGRVIPEFLRDLGELAELPILGGPR